MDANEIEVVFPLNDAICKATINPHSAVYSIATLAADGTWTWTGPGFERVNSPARALAYATERAGRKGWTLVPWSEVATINLQGATVSDTHLTVT